MSITTEQVFVERVAAHAGDRIGIEPIRAATHATLSVIGAHLPPAIRVLVSEDLAPSLGSIVELAKAGMALPIQEHVRRPGMTVAHADELVASVLTVLADELSDDVLARLQHELPDTLARRLVRPAPAVSRVGTATRDTLAEGRAGSHHPVSEDHAGRAQSDSIASKNPHDDAKLSSTTGTTQERLHETLAEGRRGSTRSIADTRK